MNPSFQKSAESSDWRRYTR